MLKWMKRLPDSDGWWWFRADEEARRKNGNTMIPVFRQGADPVILKVYKDNTYNRFMACFPSKKMPVDNMGGQWAGPVSLPEEAHTLACDEYHEHQAPKCCSSNCYCK